MKAVKKRLNTFLRSALRSEHSAKSLAATHRIVSDSDLSDDEESTSILSGYDYYPRLGSRLATMLDMYFLSDSSQLANGLRHKDQKHDRKKHFSFGDQQVVRFDKIVEESAGKVGVGTVVHVYAQLKVTRVKACNALIKKCVEEARIATDEETAEAHMHWAFDIVKRMKEQGFPLEEATYGPILEYFIDLGLLKEFYIFSGVIRSANPSSFMRLKNYEMMLWIRLDHGEKIQELCDDIESYDGENKSVLRGNYLYLLCESNRAKEILRLLESMNITKLSPHFVARIFTCLGRLLLESFAEKLLLEFKAFESAKMSTSDLICSYVVGIPNFAVEDVITKFRILHTKLEVTPSSVSYEKLVIYCCDSLQVHIALELVEEMLELGLAVSLGALHSVLQASSENCDFHLVHQIYSLIKRANQKPNCETFSSMINHCVKMKDYEGAYSMLHDSKEMRVKPSAPMYNAIMAGYFREKNTSRGLQVLEEMKRANVKPDHKTFSLLINNCNSEEDINRYYEEMKRSGIHATKQVFMALINAYAACGQFDKATEVLLDNKIPQKSFNEIRSNLVRSLAFHGQLSNAFDNYEKIKADGCSLEPQAALSLIMRLQSDEAALSRLLPLLETLEDPNHWLDGCLRIILYCVRYKHLRTAINLLEQVRDQVCTDELALDAIFDQVFSFIADSESSLQFGLDLLHAMKSELGLTPSRKCLDFLLQACVSAKDLQSSIFVWQEYQAAGLPYNTLSFLRMYQALLASGHRKAAEVLKLKIPNDDLHVRSIINACKRTYYMKTEEKQKKKNKNKKK